MKNFRTSIIVASLLVSLTLSTSCDRGNQDAGVKAITDFNGNYAFALLGVKNLVAPQLSSNPDEGVASAVRAIKSTFFAPIECHSTEGGMSAKEKLREVETLSENLLLFIDSDHKLVTFTGKGIAKKNVYCCFFGQRLVTIDVLSNAFLQVVNATYKISVPTSPEAISKAKDRYLLAQTFFLAIRGPYDLDAPGNYVSKMTGRMMEMLDGTDSIHSLTEFMTIGDPYFNPCIEPKADADVWFLKILDQQGRNWKRENYSCEKPTTTAKPRLADYRAGDDEKAYGERSAKLSAFIQDSHDTLNFDPSYSPHSRLLELLTSLDPDVWAGTWASTSKVDQKLKVLGSFLANQNPADFNFESEFKSPKAALVGESAKNIGFGLDMYGLGMGTCYGLPTPPPDMSIIGAGMQCYMIPVCRSAVLTAGAPKPQYTYVPYTERYNPNIGNNSGGTGPAWPGATSQNCPSKTYPATHSDGKPMCCPSAANSQSECSRIDSSTPTGFPNNSIPTASLGPVSKVTKDTPYEGTPSVRDAAVSGTSAASTTDRASPTVKDAIISDETSTRALTPKTPPSVPNAPAVPTPSKRDDLEDIPFDLDPEASQRELKSAQEAAKIAAADAKKAEQQYDTEYRADHEAKQKSDEEYAIRRQKEEDERKREEWRRNDEAWNKASYAAKQKKEQEERNEGWIWAGNALGVIAEAVLDTDMGYETDIKNRAKAKEAKTKKVRKAK